MAEKLLCPPPRRASRGARGARERRELSTLEVAESAGDEKRGGAKGKGPLPSLSRSSLLSCREKEERAKCECRVVGPSEKRKRNASSSLSSLCARNASCISPLFPLTSDSRGKPASLHTHARARRREVRGCFERAFCEMESMPEIDWSSVVSLLAFPPPFSALSLLAISSRALLHAMLSPSDRKAAFEAPR